MCLLISSSDAMCTLGNQPGIVMSVFVLHGSPRSSCLKCPLDSIYGLTARRQVDSKMYLWHAQAIGKLKVPISISIS